MTNDDWEAESGQRDAIESIRPSIYAILLRNTTARLEATTWRTGGSEERKADLKSETLILSSFRNCGTTARPAFENLRCGGQESWKRHWEWHVTSDDLLKQRTGVAFRAVFFCREAAKQLGTEGESAYALLRRDKWVSVEALWETAKVETTLRNARDVEKRRNASLSLRARRRRWN